MTDMDENDTGDDIAAETVTELSEHILPFGRRVRLQSVDYHNGLYMLRMIWREGRRLTIVDIDPDSAATLGQALNDWAAEKSPDNK